MHNRYPIDILLAEANRKTALLDSNLLVIWISAQLYSDTITAFKRIKPYTLEDVRLLTWLLRRFAGVATTAGVLAEVSNLANELSGELRSRWFEQLANFTVHTEEAHVGTRLVGEQPEFVRFGFTDATLSYLSTSHVIITAEYRLAGYLADLGREVLNFNNLRPLWLLQPEPRRAAL